MISPFSYCSNLKVSDLIFALQILLCGAGEGLATLFFSDFSVAAVRDREDPGDDPVLLPAKDRGPPVKASQVLTWHASLIHGIFPSGSLQY